MDCNKKHHIHTHKLKLLLSYLWSRKKKLYIYIYIFSPVKPELVIIPPGQKKKKSFNYEHLNFHGKELNVTDITDPSDPLDLKKSSYIYIYIYNTYPCSDEI